MPRLRRSAARDLMLALLALVLLLLIPAVTYPDSTVRRILFAVVLLTAVLLLLIGWAKLEQQALNLALARAEMQRLRDTLGAHVAITQARNVDATVDTQLALAREWQRSAS